MIFIWQGLPPLHFGTLESAQNKLCKVTSMRFTTSVIILSTSCDPLKPSHQEGRREIWPLQKMGSFNLSLKSMGKKRVVYYSDLIRIHALWAALCTINTHIYIFLSTRNWSWNIGCYLFQLSIFLNYLLNVFTGWGTFTCVPTHSFCCRQCDQ